MERNALPRHMYGDPADFVKFESERNKCRGCKHEMTVEIAGKTSLGCEKGKKHGHGCTLKGMV